MTPERYIITGVPPYEQTYYTNKKGKRVLTRCGPTAALMLLAYYDRRYGYRKLILAGYEDEEVPSELIQTLRNRMKTVVVSGGQGLTEPNLFKLGLKSYIKESYDVDIEEKNTLLGGTLDGVFEKSVELLQSNKPHFIVFDWDPTRLGEVLETVTPFANHYSVVIGYNTSNGKKNLIINPGWGADRDLQLIDMADKSIEPVRIIWLEMKSEPDGKQDGCSIAFYEQNPNVDFVKQSDGSFRMVPSIRKHLASERVEWRESDSTEFPIKDENKADSTLPTLSFNCWN